MTPTPRTRGQILADLHKDRAVLALLSSNDPRRAIMRARIDRLGTSSWPSPGSD